jgi:hypothetical protein
MKSSLRKFYELITTDSLLTKQFESIIHQKNFSKLLVRLGAANGYKFTVSEVESSIQENTVLIKKPLFSLLLLNFTPTLFTPFTTSGLSSLN